MKRFFPVLILVFCLAFYAAPAEISVADDLPTFTFRGLPLDVTADKFNTAMNAEGIRYNLYQEDLCLVNDFGRRYHYGNFTGCGFGWGTQVGSGAETTVAGYSAHVQAFFSYGYTENEVFQDVSHAKMYLATYTLQPANKQQTFDDLHQKLNALYYESEQYSGTDNLGLKYTGVKWVGKNGMIILSYQEYRGYVWINYVSGVSTQENIVGIQNAYKVMHMENAQDYDGLF